jgi:hypothetical protein
LSRRAEDLCLRLLFGSPSLAALISLGAYIATDLGIGAAHRFGVVKVTLLANAVVAASGGVAAGLVLPKADLPLRVISAVLFAPVAGILYAAFAAVLIGLAEAGLLN